MATVWVWGWMGEVLDKRCGNRGHLHSVLHFFGILELGESSSLQGDVLGPCYNRARSCYHWAEGVLWEDALQSHRTEGVEDEVGLLPLPKDCRTVTLFRWVQLAQELSLLSNISQQLYHSLELKGQCCSKGGQIENLSVILTAHKDETFTDLFAFHHLYIWGRIQN